MMLVLGNSIFRQPVAWNALKIASPWSSTGWAFHTAGCMCWIEKRWPARLPWWALLPPLVCKGLKSGCLSLRVIFLIALPLVFTWLAQIWALPFVERSALSRWTGSEGRCLQRQNLCSTSFFMWAGEAVGTERTGGWARFVIFYALSVVLLIYPGVHNTVWQPGTSVLSQGFSVAGRAALALSAGKEKSLYCDQFSFRHTDHLHRPIFQLKKIKFLSFALYCELKSRVFSACHPARQQTIYTCLI